MKIKTKKSISNPEKLTKKQLEDLIEMASDEILEWEEFRKMCEDLLKSRI